MDNQNQKKPVVFSGIQPTGVMTLGNYLGALKNWVKLQDDYDCYYCIVDMHALTVRQDPVQFRKNILDAYALMLACGIDPDRSTAFIQSHVKTHAELAWVLNCNTPFGELSRMTQFKDKSQKHPDNVNAGLFTYPTLMAADILLYQADLVPVGVDQKQHLELTRNIAQRFNSIYGDVFTVPEGYFGKVGSRIMSLQEPTRKMSKSDPDDCYIAILDPEDAIRRKIKRAVTDSDGEIRYDPENKPGVSNLLSIIAAMSGQELDAVVGDLQGQGYGALKNRCTEVVLDTLRPIQAEHARLMADKGYLQSILDENAQRANYLAQKTLRKIQKKVGFAAR